MTGTLINVATVMVGSVVGLIFRHRLSQRVVSTVFQGIGLFTLTLGISMFLNSQWILTVILALLFGSITGSVLKLEEKTDILGGSIKEKLHFQDERFTEGLVTAFLMFCMGSLTILGAIEEGIGKGPELLITKSVLDGFSAMALSTAMGAGVLFSAIPLLIYQGSITVIAMWVGQFFPQAIIDELSATGGILLVGLGLNILNVTKIKVTELLPALLFVILFSWMKFKGYFPFEFL
ncbi:DUF554 domain-containing protein [Thermophagus xiamenensis]|uniref:Membrane protein YdfK n=1 Tax=Thermophagus xiamenensis TaxID=385682 RepID=A0A1I2BQK2_9BACT|nr:DUF554 domain-containing protein [Thermophagus xiamenensis]SFE58385.1 hypothetical protein SAMN05444380_1149 [Thermophagus xiamenensis]